MKIEVNRHFMNGEILGLEVISDNLKYEESANQEDVESLCVDLTIEVLRNVNYWEVIEKLTSLGIIEEAQLLNWAEENFINDY